MPARRRIIYTCLAASAYIAIYFTCLKLFSFSSPYHLYTPEWTMRRVLWSAAVISVVPALFGAYRFTFITLAGYILGVIAGELLGGFQADIPPQYKHYGWFIWACVFIASIIGGIIIELRHKRKLMNLRKTV